MINNLWWLLKYFDGEMAINKECQEILKIVLMLCTVRHKLFFCVEKKVNIMY